MSWWEFRGFWGILQRSRQKNIPSDTVIPTYTDNQKSSETYRSVGFAHEPHKYKKVV
ncbi:hypothetical protein HMPREF1051_0595 [Neisseria sicca VK64]|uniref:Uncharacterized protein n=1 Tax=Neisseria sicca VK64 TaxID=1095748 RepID=I2NV76_NEISI|nr:hypothetical protein HMPREF1051_0595 [Neisseria sicca VK64]